MILPVLVQLIKRVFQVFTGANQLEMAGEKEQQRREDAKAGINSRKDRRDRKEMGLKENPYSFKVQNPYLPKLPCSSLCSLRSLRLILSAKT